MESRYYQRTIVKHSLHSRYLKEERELRVYLPPDYDEYRAYPVMYCQDGLEFFMFGRIATIATKLILDEELTPFIIAGVEVNKAARTSQYSPSGENHIPYKAFFTHEVVPFVDRAFATDPITAQRVLAGDSLGGTVSLHLALDHPPLFSKVLSLSGAFLAPTVEAIAAVADLSWLDIYMVIGDQEHEVDTETGVYDFLSRNRDVKELLLQRNACVRYLERPGKHTWGFWQNELPEALRYFFLPTSPRT